MCIICIPSYASTFLVFLSCFISFRIYYSLLTSTAVIHEIFNKINLRILSLVIPFFALNVIESLSDIPCFRTSVRTSILFQCCTYTYSVVVWCMMTGGSDLTDSLIRQLKCFGITKQSVLYMRIVSILLIRIFIHFIYIAYLSSIHRPCGK